ncbi:DNA internalization-related competence protein ComEC/Rec2 [Veronia pacifica]|uniref:DNA internalization-related competence protein ComEC/Rec2 n=1 Tax=Veronia pacifica TaxID=1080227 RepID=UPI0009F33AB8|nr:DNA internalization-related competence protein ComEC/Rec2 [Veronia pacifica]
MLWIAVGVITAVFAHRYWPYVPDGTALSLVVIVICLYLPGKFSKFIAGLIIGSVVTAYIVGNHVEKIRTSTDERKHTTIVAKVGSLFTAENFSVNKIFVVNQINDKVFNAVNGPTVRLFTDLPFQFKQGEKWQLTVKLREPFGRLNEAGFDTELYFLANHIHAKGSIVEAEKIDDTVSLRQSTYDKSYPILSTMQHQSLLTAMAFGNRDLITQNEWNVLRDSGIAHLIAISGLHIGLAYWFGTLLGKIVQGTAGEKPRLIWFPLWAGVIVAATYTWLSGFSIPAVRALTAVVCFVLLRRMSVNLSPVSTFIFILAACLLMDPLSVYSMSFWLSFGAVFVLCLTAYCPNQSDSKSPKNLASIYSGKLAALFRMQVLLTVGMAPIVVYFFQGISLYSLPINLVVVPLVSLLTVPLTLLALITLPFPPLSEFLWQLADISLKPVWDLASLARGNWLEAPNIEASWLLLLVLLVSTLLFLPVRNWLIVILVMTVTLIGWREKSPDKGQWRLTMLDVGHGLAIIIEKNKKAILYDTGNRWRQGSVAESIIGPVLEGRGIDSLDGLILSHADSDHAGGADWIEQRFAPKWKRSSSRKRDYLPCIEGEEWHWQSLTFKVIWPPNVSSRAGNKDSCVIKVSDGISSILLTGDVTISGEKKIIEKYNNIQSDIITVPHHGSKTSSSIAFLNHIEPELAINSSARYSPWRIPSPLIIDRYNSQGISWLDTSQSGQIDIYYSTSGWQVTTLRNQKALLVS